MGKLKMFNFVTLDGYFEGPNRDISWHIHDAEGDEYAIKMLKAGDTLLFGRITYELMAAYWPSPEAIKNSPTIAKGMNNADKIVFSTTLKKIRWNNTRLVKVNITEVVRNMKRQPGKNMTILGSGSIVTQFAQQGLIDEFQLMVDPVILGDGTPLFKGIRDRLNLKLTASKTFKSGVVLLSYQPIKK